MDNNLPTDNNQPPVKPAETPPPTPATPSVIIQETPEEKPQETPSETPPTNQSQTPPPEPVMPEPPKESESPKPQEPTIEIGSLDKTPGSVIQDTNGSSTPKSKSKKAKTVSAVLGLILIIAALPLATILVKQRQEIRKEAQVSPSVTIGDVQVTPTGETPPTATNGGTYSVNFKITNVSSGTRTAVLEKMICVCSEGEGNPVGYCHGCSTSNETVALSAGQSIDRTLSAHQSSGNVCGSFQLDLTVLSVQ
ncbi:hypothetical protein FJZ41_01925 [Candidatus Shapirobacteria bacterium]|nr:hypothetical protein [Candidatus Shapirobacteria bacterium]